jgi:hypothetical protein
MGHVVKQRHTPDCPFQCLAGFSLFLGEQAELRVGERQPGPVAEFLFDGQPQSIASQGGMAEDGASQYAQSSLPTLGWWPTACSAG